MCEHLLRAEGDGHVELGRVAGHRRQVEARIDEPLPELASPVGAEVEEDRGVVRVEPGCALDDERLEELVGDARLVTPLHVLEQSGRGRRYPLSVDDRVERLLRPLLALVAVHRVVPADDGRDPLGGQLGEVGHGRGRRDVAAVRERVDPRALRHPTAPCKLEQRLQMVDVRVHATARDEAEQVHVAAALACTFESGDQRRGSRTTSRP